MHILKDKNAARSREYGWPGKKNGELLALADSLFDALLTLYKNLPYHQNLDSVRIALLILPAYSNRPRLLPEEY